MLDYEAQLAAKDQEISGLRKAKIGPLFPHVPPLTSDQTKLEMSLVARTAEITQLTADKNVLEHELHELQTKYKSLITEKDAATHQIETVTHQWRTAQEMIGSMKEENRTLTEKLQRMEREKEGSLLGQQQKGRIKQLEDDLRGLNAEKQASEEAVRKQVQNNQEQYERLLRRAQTKEDEEKQLRQELLDVQSQLEDNIAQVTTLEQTKKLLQNELNEGKKKFDTELRNMLQEEKDKSHTAQQQLRQEMETQQREQQQLLATKEHKIHELSEKLKRKGVKHDAKVEKLRKEMEALQRKTHDDVTHATRQHLEQKYQLKQSELQEQFVTVQQRLTAERERALQKVTELTVEKRRIVDEHNTKVTELQQQIEALRVTVNKEEWVVSDIECPFVIKQLFYVLGVSPTSTTVCVYHYDLVYMH